jgi:hypothetical protein
MPSAKLEKQEKQLPAPDAKGEKDKDKGPFPQCEIYFARKLRNLEERKVWCSLLLFS